MRSTAEGLTSTTTEYIIFSSSSSFFFVLRRCFGCRNYTDGDVVFLFLFQEWIIAGSPVSRSRGRMFSINEPARNKDTQRGAALVAAPASFRRPIRECSIGNSPVRIAPVCSVGRADSLTIKNSSAAKTLGSIARTAVTARGISRTPADTCANAIREETCTRWTFASCNRTSLETTLAEDSKARNRKKKGASNGSRGIYL